MKNILAVLLVKIGVPQGRGLVPLSFSFSVLVISGVAFPFIEWPKSIILLQSLLFLILKVGLLWQLI